MSDVSMGDRGLETMLLKEQRKVRLRLTADLTFVGGKSSHASGTFELPNKKAGEPTSTSSYVFGFDLHLQSFLYLPSFLLSLPRYFLLRSSHSRNATKQEEEEEEGKEPQQQHEKPQEDEREGLLKPTAESKKDPRFQKSHSARSAGQSADSIPQPHREGEEGSEDQHGGGSERSKRLRNASECHPTTSTSLTDTTHNNTHNKDEKGRPVKQDRISKGAKDGSASLRPARVREPGEGRSKAISVLGSSEGGIGKAIVGLAADPRHKSVAPETAASNRNNSTLKSTEISSLALFGGEKILIRVIILFTSSLFLFLFLFLFLLLFLFLFLLLFLFLFSFAFSLSLFLSVALSLFLCLAFSLSLFLSNFLPVPTALSPPLPKTSRAPLLHFNSTTSLVGSKCFPFVENRPYLACSARYIVCYQLSTHLEEC